MRFFRKSKTKQRPGATDADGMEESTYLNEGGTNRLQRKRSLRRGDQPPRQQDRIEQSRDDERFDLNRQNSIGECLAPSDQFDLYVPIKDRHCKGILRNSGVIGGGSSTRYEGMEPYRGGDGTSTVSSLSIGTFDNHSMEAKYSPSQGAVSNTAVGKSPSRRRKKTAQQREQAEMVVAAESPVPPCINTCCGDDRVQPKRDLRDGDLSLADNDGTENEQKERESAKPRKKMSASSPRHESVSGNNNQSRYHSSRRESKHRGRGDGVDENAVDNGNSAVVASSSPGFSPPQMTNTSNDSSSFPLCFMVGLCGPQDVSDTAITDESMLSSSSVVLSSSPSGVFQSYQRPSVPHHPVQPSSTFQRVPLPFDMTQSENDVVDHHMYTLPLAGLTNPAMSAKQERFADDQHWQKDDHHHHHHHHGDDDRRYYYNSNTVSINNDNIAAISTEEGDLNRHDTYDDEGLTTFAVVEMDQQQYGWDGNGMGDPAGNSSDQPMDGGEGRLYVQKLKAVDTDDGYTSGWKMRLPRVRSVPKIGKIGRSRSFQRNRSNSNTGPAPNAARSNSTAISRGGRSRTIETVGATTVGESSLGAAEDNNRSKSNGVRRRNSRSRSRSRTRPSPFKTATSVTTKDRKGSSRMPAGKEIDPMDLI
jgi:hypothetical protein